jgi:hypothetical protein
MTLDRAGAFIWLIGAMVLVGSALMVRRRVPRGRMLAMALIWIAIFALLFGIARRLDRSASDSPRPTGLDGNVSEMT